MRHKESSRSAGRIPIHRDLGALLPRDGVGDLPSTDIDPTLFFEPTFTGREAGLFRLVGWIMAVVGWFLWIGGRTGARAFVAAGIVARLAVPLVAIPLALTGTFPHMLYVFGVLDPLSGLVTWRLMTKTVPSS